MLSSTFRNIANVFLVLEYWADSGERPNRVARLGQDFLAIGVIATIFTVGSAIDSIVDGHTPLVIVVILKVSAIVMVIGICLIAIGAAKRVAVYMRRGY